MASGIDSDFTVVDWSAMGVPVQLGSQQVVVHKNFFMDFERLHPVARTLSIAGELVVGRPLETVVDRLFNEVVCGDPALLLKVTEEACQSGVPRVLEPMMQAYQNQYGELPCPQNPTTGIAIGRNGDNVFMTVNVEWDAQKNSDGAKLAIPRRLTGSLTSQISVAKVLHGKPDITV